MAGKKVKETSSIKQKGNYYFQKDKYAAILERVQEIELKRGEKFNSVTECLEELLHENKGLNNSLDTINDLLNESNKASVYSAKAYEENLQLLNNRVSELIESNLKLSRDLEDGSNIFSFPEFVNFTFEVEEAFKVLFANPDFNGLRPVDVLELMLDYCKRDPSNEFPFEPVATKIYNNLKSMNHETGNETNETETAGITGADNELGRNNGTIDSNDTSSPGNDGNAN